MASQTKEVMTEMMDQLNDTASKTMRSLSKFQEESARFWADSMGRGMEEFRSYCDKVAQDTLPFNKKSVERVQRLVDEQSQKGMDLLKQSFEVAQSHDAPEAYDRMMSLWRKSFDTMRASAESMARANTEMFEGWTQCVKALVASGNGKTRPSAK